MFRLIVAHLQDNPKAGIAGTGGSFVAGILPECTNITRDDVLFWFQILAFTATILVGFLTAYAQLLKIRKIRKNENK